MANFLLKFGNIRYLGNRGWCDTNFVCTLKFADPGNPILYTPCTMKKEPHIFFVENNQCV